MFKEVLKKSYRRNLFIEILLFIGVFSQRHNVVLVKDLSSFYSFGKTLVSEILNKLPLDQYRVSLYSTNRIIQQFQDFQSRTCLLKVLTCVNDFFF